MLGLGKIPRGIQDQLRLVPKKHADTIRADEQQERPIPFHGQKPGKRPGGNHAETEEQQYMPEISETEDRLPAGQAVIVKRPAIVLEKKYRDKNKRNKKNSPGS